MAKINTNDNLNQGLPENTGLDDGTRAALQRQLDGKDGGTAVGSFRDLQVGEVGNPIEGNFDPSVNVEELSTVPEIAANEKDAQAPGRSNAKSDKRSKK